ncbi:hypothetical protein R3W88_025135 [Solanum pinnatisectum]|uniref:CCHC-type domain-containing protein n=1 Tax=Solanum pinnatisectum TaxID=50273 RepID=A0AAV9M642_9SOLN|nr:hypothetical protein R3W88_025135 [Solanum pinnatisectum]
MGYIYLQNRLSTLWQPSEKINLIDLGEEFYLIKLTRPENFEKILHKGPWFIGSQLPELPTEFYDLSILQKIGNEVGSVLKVDRVTKNTTRGRYARLCILAPLTKPLPTEVLIGTHLQKIHYEPSTPLCTSCGRLGHLVHSCPRKVSNIPSTSNQTKLNNDPSDTSTNVKENGGWTTVIYPKKYRKQTNNNTTFDQDKNMAQTGNHRMDPLNEIEHMSSNHKYTKQTFLVETNNREPQLQHQKQRFPELDTSGKTKISIHPSHVKNLVTEFSLNDTKAQNVERVNSTTIEKQKLSIIVTKATKSNQVTNSIGHTLTSKISYQPNPTNLGISSTSPSNTKANEALELETFPSIQMKLDHNQNNLNNSSSISKKEQIETKKFSFQSSPLNISITRRSNRKKVQGNLKVQPTMSSNTLNSLHEGFKTNSQEEILHTNFSQNLFNNVSI